MPSCGSSALPRISSEYAVLKCCEAPTVRYLTGCGMYGTPCVLHMVKGPTVAPWRLPRSPQQQHCIRHHLETIQSSHVLTARVSVLTLWAPCVIVHAFQPCPPVALTPSPLAAARTAPPAPGLAHQVRLCINGTRTVLRAYTDPLAANRAAAHRLSWTRVPRSPPCAASTTPCAPSPPTAGVREQSGFTQTASLLHTRACCPRQESVLHPAQHWRTSS